MRRIRNKFRRPKTPWDSARIIEERKIMNNYGLRRKREIHAASEILRNFRRRARDLIAMHDAQKEKTLLNKLVKLGLLNEKQGLDDVLALSIENILNRRLQTIVFKKGLAKSIKEARQLIVHGHIIIERKKITIPSCMIPFEKEKNIDFHSSSNLKTGK